MYLFTRAGRFGPGSIREAMTFVGTITEKVHQETGLDVHAWISTMSPDLGRAVWATFVDDLTHLEEANDKLNVSEAFMQLAEQGSKLFIEPLSDGLARVVHGEPDLSAPLPGYISSVRATAANGHLAEATSNGVELAETAARITGIPTMFLVDATGTYGGCRWTSRFATIGDVERAEAALVADESWLQLIDRVGPSYTPGTTQALYRRLV